MRCREGAPRTVQTKLLLGWSAIGLKVVDDRSDRSVLGWAVRHSSPEFVLLGADSRIGMPGELLFKRGHDALMFATFVQQDNLIARTVWPATETAHVRVVRQILEQASRRHRAPMPAMTDEAATTEYFIITCSACSAFVNLVVAMTANRGPTGPTATQSPPGFAVRPNPPARGGRQAVVGIDSRRKVLGITTSEPVEKGACRAGQRTRVLTRCLVNH